MKHIRKFEELDWNTYYNAGKKLKDMARKPGGRMSDRDKTNIHYKRGVEIHKYAYTKEYKDLGILSICEKGISKNAMVTSIHIDPLNFYEGFIYEDGRSETGHITMFVGVYDMEKSDAFELFFISVPLRWKDDKFYVDGDVSVDTDGLYLTDRQSALKIRKAIQMEKWVGDLTCDTKAENYDENLDIKHQFMLHSTPDEYTKMISMFNNIPINKLYK